MKQEKNRRDIIRKSNRFNAEINKPLRNKLKKIIFVSKNGFFYEKQEKNRIN